jgi:hypothetical protein
MSRKYSKRSRLGQRYIDWRNGLPPAWRIVYDIVSTIVVIAAAIYAFMWAVELLILLVPIFILFGLVSGGGGSRSSDQQWYDDNDPRGNGPRSMAPDYFK